MTFVKFKSKFEENLSQKTEFQLAYIKHYPEGFDGGTLIYKIADRYIRLDLDGKEEWFTVTIAHKDSEVWTELIQDGMKELLKNRIDEIVAATKAPVV
jgi:hypothetical protein